MDLWHPTPVIDAENDMVYSILIMNMLARYLRLLNPDGIKHKYLRLVLMHFLPTSHLLQFALPI